MSTNSSSQMQAANNDFRNFLLPEEGSQSTVVIYDPDVWTPGGNYAEYPVIEDDTESLWANNIPTGRDVSLFLVGHGVEKVGRLEDRVFGLEYSTIFSAVPYNVSSIMVASCYSSNALDYGQYLPAGVFVYPSIGPDNIDIVSYVRDSRSESDFYVQDAENFYLEKFQHSSYSRIAEMSAERGEPTDFREIIPHQFMITGYGTIDLYDQIAAMAGRPFSPLAINTAAHVFDGGLTPYSPDTEEFTVGMQFFDLAEKITNGQPLNNDELAMACVLMYKQLDADGSLEIWQQQALANVEHNVNREWLVLEDAAWIFSIKVYGMDSRVEARKEEISQQFSIYGEENVSAYLTASKEFYRSRAMLRGIHDDEERAILYDLVSTDECLAAYRADPVGYLDSLDLTPEAYDRFQTALIARDAFDLQSQQMYQIVHSVQTSASMGSNDIQLTEENPQDVVAGYIDVSDRGQIVRI